MLRQAQYASSEAIIAADKSLCSDPGADLESQIRADFTNCALPANALSGTCISGSDNESNDCGFANSTIGFCQYCGAGGQNSTDTCCYNSRAELRCADVVLPTLTSYMTFGPTETATSTAPTDTPTETAVQTSKSDDGLSGGAIAGIVIGSLAGAAVVIGLLALLFLCCRRRRRGSQNGSVFNQPTPPRKGAPQMTQNAAGEPQVTPEGYEVLPGGRIARMSALEGHSSGKDLNGAALAAAGIAGYAAGGRRNHEPSSSDEYESPGSNKAGVLRPPPTTRRNGSLSSGSALGNEEFSSPRSASNGMSSPQGMASQQSEQLASFKDYYSPEEIHPGDKVATLWGYQPRAGDEFALERGDMLKVVGIWDDAWATGVLLKDRAEDWDIAHNSHRDSGVSNTSEADQGTPAPSGEIKAFPLVCVCLPDHWQKTIEGEASTETGSSVPGMPI